MVYDTIMRSCYFIQSKNQTQYGITFKQENDQPHLAHVMDFLAQQKKNVLPWLAILPTFSPVVRHASIQMVDTLNIDFVNCNLTLNAAVTNMSHTSHSSTG